MQLLELECLGQSLVLQQDQDGFQRLYWAGQVVSEVDLSRSYRPDLAHRFELRRPQAEAESVDPEKKVESADRIVISLNIQSKDNKAAYQLWQGEAQLDSGEFLLPETVTVEKEKTGWLGLVALVFKLFKSAKVVKVALAGASVAGYAWLFTLEFALVLVACLVIHEYGHVRAMQYFGIKTKGIYLIPFVGGLAVSDDKINTRWQDVVISIMGPCFGLLMSIICLILYGITDLELFAGAAVISSLLNLFNLLPILPLDGGHVLKSISFSMRSWIGLSVCMAGIALGAWIAYTFGLALLVFFLFIGALEAVMQWRERHASHLIPLDRYGQIFSSLWYVLTVVGHVLVMISFADSDNAILKLPLLILSS